MQNQTEYKLAPLPVRLAVRFLAKVIIPAALIIGVLVVLHAIPVLGAEAITNWMGR